MTTRPHHHYTPTRRCPHRWCPPTHKLLFAGGLVVTLLIGMRSPSLLMFMSIGSVLVAAVVWRVIYKKSLRSALHDEQVEIVRLTVYPFWARLAAASDVLMCAIMLFDGTQYFSGGFRTPNGINPDAALATLVITGVVFFLYEYAHYRATRPGRGKRVPAALRNEA